MFVLILLLTWVAYSQGPFGKYRWCCTSANIWTIIINWWSHSSVEWSKVRRQWESRGGLPRDIWFQCWRQGHFSPKYLQWWNNCSVLFLEGIVQHLSSLLFITWVLEDLQLSCCSDFCRRPDFVRWSTVYKLWLELSENYESCIN